MLAPSCCFDAKSFRLAHLLSLVEFSVRACGSTTLRASLCNLGMLGCCSRLLLQLGQPCIPRCLIGCLQLYGVRNKQFANNK